ncbi:MAG TPA: hypothetical protein VIQ31_24705, partial [Phormidium sp.]
MESRDMQSLLILVVGGPALAGAVLGVAVLVVRVVRAVKEAVERPRRDPDPDPNETPIVPPPPKESSILVLVISASHADFLESLKDKKHIDVSEGEQLYQITRYLWLGSETELSQKRPDINEYSVAKGAESEYNIYLVEIKL